VEGWMEMREKADELYNRILKFYVDDYYYWIHVLAFIIMYYHAFTAKPTALPWVFNYINM
jgi:hypothetical protein